MIAVGKSADLVVMVLDAAKEFVKNHREILERELELVRACVRARAFGPAVPRSRRRARHEQVGLRLNKTPPNIAFRRKATGGVKFNTTVPLTKVRWRWADAHGARLLRLTHSLRWSCVAGR